MKLLSLYILTIHFLIIITFIHSTIAQSYDLEKILNKDYISDVEYIFDQNSLNDDSDSESIRKYFHQFKETSINLDSGASLKCYIPSKLTRDFGDHFADESKIIKEIPENLAYLFMKVISQLCYNTSIKEWFYKICPLKSATQTLNYKKKDEDGKEYTEMFNIGTNSFNHDFDKFAFYRNDADTLYNLYPQIKLSERFTIISYGNRLVKYFNPNFHEFRSTDKEIIVYYDVNFIKKIMNLPGYHNEQQYILDNPTDQLIPIRRKVFKQIGDSIFLLDSPLPGPIVQKDIAIDIKEQRQKSINHSFTLSITGEFIYCFRCEFLTYYSTGDVIFIKNGKWNPNKVSQTKMYLYQGRTIVSILDNNLIKVSSPFDSNYNSSMRSGYLTMDSNNSKINWKCGIGSITFKKNLVIGNNTSFLTQIKQGDRLFLLNSKDISDSIHLTSTNKKFKYSNECLVDIIISDTIFTTQKPCLILSNFTGHYFIGRDNTDNTDNLTAKHLNIINDNSPSNYYGKYYDQELDQYINQYKQEVIDSKIDFYTFDSVSIFKKDMSFYTGNYLFHPGLILKAPSFSVFRFKIYKHHQHVAKLRLILSNSLEDYNNKEINPANSYELIFNSDSGILLKKLDNTKEIEFYSTEIRSLFQDTIAIEIIFLDDNVYINTTDDYLQSSIKLKIKLPNNDTIKFIAMDLYNSYNTHLKSIRLFNTIEQKYLVNVFEFQKKLLLNDKSYFMQEMIGGDDCEGVGQRKTIVIYECDTTGNHDIHFDKVEEVSMCVYKYFLKTKWMCNPYDIMKNKITMGVAKTKCIIQNEDYNKGSADLFLNTDKL